MAMEIMVDKKAVDKKVPKRKKPRGLVADLAVLDLRHEWILTLCMVLAIAAILAPLLILLGLKYGTIETMRERLIEDPVNREIKPARTLHLEPDWFETFAAREDVAFVVPTILRGSSVVRIITAKKRRGHVIDLVPTNGEDPLILENAGIVPKKGECVLSYPASEELGISAGEILTARITRSRRGKREFVETKLFVTSVLNPRADGLSRIYAPLKFVTDVELYREGQAVPKRNWSGTQPRPFLSFDGIFVILAAPLRSIETRRLIINTGLADIIDLKPGEFKKAMGFPLPSEYTAYKLIARGNTIQIDNIKRIKNKLRGKSAIVLPFVENVSLTLNQKTEIKVVGLSVSSSQAEMLGIPPLAWNRLDFQATFSKKAQVLLPQALEMTDGQSIHASAAGFDTTIKFHIINSGNSFGDYAIIPTELIGTLKTGTQRRIFFDDKQSSFLLARAGYRGFRLYARSIDDVPKLYRNFIDQDIDVITQVQEIERVKILDRGLTRIFWLVAIIGIVGGIAALIASLYAAVDRKKRDLGMLRLMGFSRNAVFWFPIYQGVAIAILSVIFAIGGYAILSWIINTVFAADLRIGENICFLPNEYFIITFVATTGAAAMSSLLAAWKTTGIEPAEAIREE
jgi:putative ABC transport system permease protein